MLPQRQRDLNAVKPLQKTLSVKSFIKELMLHHIEIVAKAFLFTKGAQTIPMIAWCVQNLSPSNPRIQHGQIYLRPDWRIRYTWLPDTLQAQIYLLEPIQPQDLLAVIAEHFDEAKLRSIVYDIIGPARLQGVLSVLRQKQPLLALQK